MKMRYFQSVQGRAFLRPGRSGIYIGCKRKPKKDGVSPGFMWDTDAVTAVTEDECNRNLRDYSDAVRDKVLIETDEDAFKAAAEKKVEDQRKAQATKKTKAANAKLVLAKSAENNQSAEEG